MKHTVRVEVVRRYVVRMTVEADEGDDLTDLTTKEREAVELLADLASPDESLIESVTEVGP